MFYLYTCVLLSNKLFSVKIIFLLIIFASYLVQNNNDLWTMTTMNYMTINIISGLLHVLNFEMYDFLWTFRKQI